MKRNIVLRRFLSLALALLMFVPVASQTAFAAESTTTQPDGSGSVTTAPTPVPLPFFPSARQTASKTDTAVTQLIPGGMPFGVRLHSKGILVVGLTEINVGGKTCRPAYDGGVRKKDILLEIDGQTVSSAEEATAKIAASNGKPICLTVLRDDAQMSLTVTPQKSDKDGCYRLGLYLRDTTSGIGTVTFIDPESGLFGGLGHGVCDADTGALVPLSRGSVLSVRITGIKRGEVHAPGELRGSLGAKRMGALVTNSESGVFGVLSEVPKTDRQALPVATASEVKEGKATLLCTLGDDGIREYDMEIVNIDRGGRPTKSFTVRITDEELLSRTGGIVQGMSGSPIIQNGKIVGAVTHVLVDDPTGGYGIFIENMLSAMKMRAAA